MNRNLTTLIVFFMVFVNAAFAQKGIINGVISDKGSGEKIPFASVVLLKNNQATSYGTISDDGGAFKLNNLDRGDYSVVVSFIGYATDTINNITISKENTTVNLRDIKLAVSSVALEGIEVTTMS